MQWVTRDAGTPTVMLGTQAGALTQTVTGNTTAYTHERRPCWKHAPDTLHPPLPQLVKYVFVQACGTRHDLNSIR